MLSNTVVHVFMYVCIYVYMSICILIVCMYKWFLKEGGLKYLCVFFLHIYEDEKQQSGLLTCNILIMTVIYINVKLWIFTKMIW